MGEKRKTHHFIEPSNFTSKASAEISREMLRKKGWTCSPVREYTTHRWKTGYTFRAEKDFVIGHNDQKPNQNYDIAEEAGE